VIVTTPMYHGYGLATCLMAMCLGSQIHIRKHFKASEICELIEKQAIEVITLVPLVLRRILNESESNFTSLKAILSGGAALEESLVTNTQTRLGKILFNLYGTSEAGFCILANPNQLKRNPSTIGKPIEGVRIRINEPEKSYGCGELLVKNRWSVSRTKWIHTGDLARINEDGFVQLMGRSDDMIVSGGVNVYPIELENLLFQHPGVELAKVAGIQDDEFGQRLKAYLVLKPGVVFNESEFKDWIRRFGSRFIVPKSIQFLKEIPHNEIGKINIRNLPDIDL
jgi:acyl-CoA synthetase (AMP-forming)/AMP-acid ligase II